jgi:hypothetical protein
MAGPLTFWPIMDGPLPVTDAVGTAFLPSSFPFDSFFRILSQRKVYTFQGSSSGRFYE